MKRILIVVGTRPNFIKVTRFKTVADGFDDIDIQIVHTGQHYDRKMSDVFFDQFNLVPDYFLNVEPASPATQMGRIMEGLEEVAQKVQPDVMLVVGDVNSTLAGAIVANKMNITLAHLESGLRSEDRSMPEEINRILTDEITDHFFVTEQSGLDNLRAEGKLEHSIHFVGNTMIDTLVGFEGEINKNGILSDLNLQNQEFVLITIHRPATVDNKENFEKLLSIFESISGRKKMIFPIHPRTMKCADKFGLQDRLKRIEGLNLTGPLDYFSFQKLIASCAFVLTDSGGIQEETTFRKVPCLTLRPNTERPSTLSIGSNQLLELDAAVVNSKVDEILEGKGKKGEIPPLWDGKTTERVIDVFRTKI